MHVLLEKFFLAVPDPKLAREHLQILTAAPHVAGSPERRRTAEYVLQQYTAAGLDASIQPYKVWMALPLDIALTLIRIVTPGSVRPLSMRSCRTGYRPLPRAYVRKCGGDSSPVRVDRTRLPTAH